MARAKWDDEDDDDGLEEEDKKAEVAIPHASDLTCGARARDPSLLKTVHDWWKSKVHWYTYYIYCEKAPMQPEMISISRIKQGEGI